MAYKISKYLFLALIVSLPVFRPPIFTTVTAPVPISDAIFLACAFFFLISLALRQTRPVWDRSFVFLALFVASLVISTIFSETPGRSVIKLAGHFYLIGIAVLSVQFSRDANFWRNAILAWLVGLSITIVAVLLGLLLFALGFNSESFNYFLFHFGSLPAGFYPRVMALFGNPNMLCTYLAASVPIVLAAKKIGWIGKFSSVVLLSGIVVATAFSISPGIGGVILSSGMWMLFAGPFGPKVRRSIATVTVVGAIGFFAAAMVSLESPNSEKEFRIPGTSIVLEPSVRTFTWQSAAQTFADNPLIGKGTGTDAAYVRYQSLAGPRQLLLDAHNMWLSIAAQTGLIGITVFCILLFHLLRRCRFRKELRNDMEILHLAFSCSFVGGFIYQGLTGSFEDARHVWLSIGLLCGVALDAKSNQNSSA